MKKSESKFKKLVVSLLNIGLTFWVVFGLLYGVFFVRAEVTGADAIESTFVQSVADNYQRAYCANRHAICDGRGGEIRQSVIAMAEDKIAFSGKAEDWYSRDYEEVEADVRAFVTGLKSLSQTWDKQLSLEEPTALPEVFLSETAKSMQAEKHDTRNPMVLAMWAVGVLSVVWAVMVVFNFLTKRSSLYTLPLGEIVLELIGMAVFGILKALN